MLAARATAEVVAAEQNARVRVARLVENEIRIRYSVVRLLVATTGKQSRSQTRARDVPYFSRRNDCVGTDVGPQERYRDACQSFEALHHCYSSG